MEQITFVTAPSIEAAPSAEATRAYPLVPRTLQIVMLAGIFTLGWLTVALVGNHGNAMAFIEIGTMFTKHDPAGNKGYDGQFAYYIATKGFDARYELAPDIPIMRFQRILYPALIWILSFGVTGLMPWVMIGINVLSLLAITALLATWLTRYGSPPAYALLFVVWVGTIFVLRLDLIELLCIGFGLLGLTFIADNRYKPAIIALALSLLTREMGALFIGTAALYLWTRQRRQAVLLVILSLIPYAIWTAIVNLSLGGALQLVGNPGATLIPFDGYANAKSPVELVIMIIWLILPALLIGAWAVYKLIKGQRGLPVYFAIFAALWVICLPRASTYDLVAAFRLASPLVIGAILLAASFRQRRLLLYFSAFWIPAILLAFLVPGFFG